MSAREFDKMFPDGETCCAYLVARRWPDGVRCPRCGAEKPHKLSNRPWSWQCYQCAPATSYRFSHIAGTIFENTNKPLREWFKVAHLMLASKKGMSALQIMRYMGFGSYKTAWGMCHKIRTALMQNIDKLGGIVEMDETFIGGKDKNRHWNKKKGHHDDKTTLIGAVQRKGNVVARVLERMTTQAAIDFVTEVCSNKVSLLATDSWPGYQDLPANIPHGSVDHSQHQYVIGAIHTNTIEGFWSIFKRGVVGTFHKMSRKYMPLYVAEFQFRYNNRRNADIFGTAIAGC